MSTLILHLLSGSHFFMSGPLPVGGGTAHRCHHGYRTDYGSVGCHSGGRGSGWVRCGHSLDPTDMRTLGQAGKTWPGPPGLSNLASP